VSAQRWADGLGSMTILRSFICLSFAASAALLAGCGGSQPPIGAPGAMQSQTEAVEAHFGKSWLLPEAKSDDLLYVSSYTPGVGSDIAVYTYPGGRRVGDLGSEISGGLCSDATGDVFIVEESGKVVEYAHGGTQPIATLNDLYNAPHSCAVDPSSGNLAVAGGHFPEYYVDANVAIFPNATGTPTIYYYANDLTFSWCTYDDRGNLFANGQSFKKGASDLVELPAGSSTFSPITVQNANIHGNGSIQWDGHYLAIVKLYAGNNKKGPATIYQLQISGQNGKVVNTIELEGSHVSDRNDGNPQQFWLYNHTISSPESTDNRVGLWDYPAGGDPIRSNAQAEFTPLGLTVSVGPGHR
jgi:hypothetical protein